MRIIEKCRQHLLPVERRTPPELRPLGCGDCYECISNEGNKRCTGNPNPVREQYDENAPEIFVG